MPPEPARPRVRPGRCRSIVFGTVRDPLTDHVDGLLVEEGPALGHLAANSLRALQLVDEVAVVRVTRFHPVEGNLQALHANERRETVRRAAEVHAAWQIIASRPGMTAGAHRREYLLLDLGQRYGHAVLDRNDHVSRCADVAGSIFGFGGQRDLAVADRRGIPVESIG